MAFLTEHRSQLWLVVALAACFVLSLFEHSISPYYYTVIIYIGVNIILASSLNLINGFAGQFSLGHAGFMAIGAYTSAYCTQTFQAQPDTLSGNVLFLIALLIAGLVAAVFGVLVGIPSLRLKGDYLAIVTLGFGEIIRVIIQNLDFLGGARGFTGIPEITNFAWVFCLAAVLIFMIANLVRSTYGKGFLAVADDEISAEAMGINSTYYKVVAFVTGAFFAGMAGGLYAHFVTYVNPAQFGFIKSIELVVMVIVGGMGNTIGVILAAALLTILPEALRPIAQYRMVIYSLMLVIIMITRPQGLFGHGLWMKKMWRRYAHAPRGAES
ncbi:MAG: branched-chain amino acid ABC transporter permease [candidate division Zixibacteria bacterium]|nr:branched-chain amino acid ABC transporter permease [candidate division Zixibacteria bacterium]